jgi:hypothetical protein
VRAHNNGCLGFLTSKKLCFEIGHHLPLDPIRLFCNGATGVDEVLLKIVSDGFERSRRMHVSLADRR